MGRPSKPISKEQILDAQSRTKSNRAAARYLGISYIHYKKYAKLFKTEDGTKTLFAKHLNRQGKGIAKFLSKKGQVGSIKDIIEGKISIDNFAPQKIKDKLINEGYLKEECCKCSINERRILDNKIPLIINFLDGNKRNYKLNNIELLCYNCYFLYVGDVFTKKQVEHLEDFTPIPEPQKIDWELDPYFEEHFKSLGFGDEPKDDGSEYISRK